MAKADGEIIDLRTPTEVCVIGHGPAGLTVATHLVRRGISVTLLDRGAMTHDPSGASKQLDARFSPLASEDFAPRSWVAGSGWPIDVADLEPWLQKARDHLSVDDGSEPSATGTELPVALRSDFDAKQASFGTDNELQQRLRGELRNNPLCRLESEAVALELSRAPRNGAITSVRYQTRTSTETVKASTFVLACNGIENARLLLASDRGNGGIGNEHGNVGRYYMDHPVFSIGHIDAERKTAAQTLAFFHRSSGLTGGTQGYAATSASLCEELEATRVAVSLFPTSPNPKSILDSISRIVRGKRRSSGPRFEVVVQCEQPPLVDSRVTLAYDIDAYGSPLPRVDWLIGEQVRSSVLAVQQRLAAHLAQAGLGTYVPRTGSFDELGMPARMNSQLGTTRMSDRPKDGVVNSDGKVHHVPNLFIAGGSVFPTSGAVNPTLTVIALAERLADHIATIANRGQPPISPKTGALPD